MNPISTVSDAITLPLKAVGVVGLCFVINWMTSPGYWWVKWVALGMGIAVVSAWWRAFRLVALTAVIAALGAWAYKHWGDAGRARVQQWLGPQPPAPPQS
ncbi:MAG: 2TM domain-containing protein [Lysobacteraceae bacterium]